AHATFTRVARLHLSHRQTFFRDPAADSPWRSTLPGVLWSLTRFAKGLVDPAGGGCAGVRTGMRTAPGIRTERTGLADRPRQHPCRRILARKRRYEQRPDF